MRASISIVWFPKAPQNYKSALTLWGQVRTQPGHPPTVAAAHGGSIMNCEPGGEG